MSNNNSYVHLHVHTEFSLLDGLSRIDKLVKRAKDLDMPALAITDHGTMFGVIDFYDACKAAGIKPIIGVEAYLAPNRMTDRDPKLDKRPFHMLLLAKNQTGYQNLLKITSAAQLEGYYYRPRVDWEFLQQHAEGLIATTGCLAAKVPSLVMEGQDDAAYGWIGRFQELFGAENFYLELQRHDIPELVKVNKWLTDYRKTGHTPVQLLVTNDVHYVSEEDYQAHDTLLCIQTTTLKSDTNRLRMSDNSYYLNSPQEVWREFGEVPEAIHNSLKIAEMCEINLDRKGYHLPIFPVPDGFDNASYLQFLCEIGLDWRFGSRKTEAVLTQRLERELGIINNMGFASYFLIVWDLCQYARHADIWWNVRGSGAGSLAAYCLGITNIDPIQNQLLFERFLNPGRVTMPDIDLDFPDDRRGEMIAYTARKYGEDKVAAIITFGTMGAKAAVKDVARALDVPLSEVNRVAALIPQEAKQKPLEEYVNSNPDLLKIYNSDERLRDVIDTAKALQGVSRHASTHAAGVIVSDKSLMEYLPLHRITGKDPSGGALKAVTQFTMETCESIGLLKIDFLGLSTLTIFRKTCELIKKYHGVNYTMDNVPYYHDDPRLTDKDRADLDEAFRLIGRGDTVGVFQLESTGMQQMLRDMRPKQFENIVAAVSLYRPGPMEFIPQYNRRLHGEEKTVYRHPKLEPILKETFGILVYQEQLMQVASELFGYELGEADLMRRAVSKKKEKDLAQHRSIFLERGPKYDVDEDIANKIFDDIEFFANYGFNKCVVGTTEIIDTDTGRLIRVADLAARKETVSHTLTCDPTTLRLNLGQITAVMENGLKSVYRLTTQLGRQIEATANHPFLTFDGWKQLGELSVGDKVAVPRSIGVEGRKSWSDHEVIVLGHLLAEGNLTNPFSLYFYTNDELHWQDYTHNLEKFPNTIGSTHQRRGMYDVYAKRVNRKLPAGVVTWVDELGLRGTTSYTRFVPDEVFELNNRQIALLIARMWEGDGHINVTDRSANYATSSERLARQLQHLLLRLGIISRLRRVNFAYKDGRIGFQLFVTGNNNLSVFSEKIGTHFIRCERSQKLEQLVLSEVDPSGTKDIIPVQVKTIVQRERIARAVGWDVVAEKAGVSISELYRHSDGTKSGFTRPVIARLAEYFDCDDLRRYSSSDVYWDKVVSIEPAGDQKTYDLTIEGTHNFVANDIIVHNSHAADYAVLTVQTAFLKAHYQEEFMTALLTVHQDDSTKVATFLEECRRLHIPILPPDVNYSALEFDIQPDPATKKRGIRFGLAAIKNAGAGALQPIVDARQTGGPFTDVDDFCRRVDLRHVGKRTLESLAKVGALEAFGGRSQLVQAIDRMMSFSAGYYKDKEVGQMNMFGDSGGMAGDILTNLPSTEGEEVSTREMLGWEKELLGLYVTGRPVDKFREALQQSNSNHVAALKEDGAQYHTKQVAIAGLITSMRKIFTKNSEPMGVLTVEDWHDSAGTIEVVLFPRTWSRVADMVSKGEIRDFDEGSVVMVRGKFDMSRGDAQIVADIVTQNFTVLAASEPLPVQIEQVPSWASSIEPPPRDYADQDMPSWVMDARESDFDEETGEVSKPEPVPEPELVAAVAPATQGALAVAIPTVEPQIAPARLVPDEVAGWKHDADLDDPWAEEEAPRQRWLVIYFPRSGDDDKDRRRFARLHGLLVSYPGQDRFSIVMEGRRRTEKFEFPNHTTGHCEDLIRDLLSVVETMDNIQVFERPD